MENEEDFITTALGMLAMGDTYCQASGVCQAGAYCAAQSVDPVPLTLRQEVNDAIRNQNIATEVGTTMGAPGCEGRGEYDTMLKGYVRMMVQFRAQLDPDVQYRLMQLLDKRGGFDSHDLTRCNIEQETENHLLSTETSRLLTNELLMEGAEDKLFYPVNYAPDRAAQFDNNANGLNEWMLRHLQTFVQHDFLEYNSRPYQALTDPGLLNLYDLSHDQRVRTGAQIVLDYLSAKYAVSSDSSRRSVPYRRRVGNYSQGLLDNNSDPQKDRMMIVAGQTEILADSPTPGNANFNGRDLMQYAALSSYRIPPTILGVLTDTKDRNFFQRFHGSGVEIYAGTPDFIISAGGIYLDGPYAVSAGPLTLQTSDDEAVVLPTVLLPSGHGIDVSHLIQIVGHGVDPTSDRDERLNTCVAPGFACGLNPTWPENYIEPGKPKCWSKQAGAQPGSTWVFIDRSTPECKNDQSSGFFAAVLRVKHSPDDYGFFEARAKAPGLTLASFTSAVLGANGHTNFVLLNDNTYTTSDGRAIRFRFQPENNNKYTWGIERMGTPADVGLNRNIAQWPLAQGDIVSAGGDGLVVVHGPQTHTTLTLDYRNAMQPVRSEGLTNVAHPTVGGLTAPQRVTLARTGPLNIKVTWEPGSNSSWETVEWRVAQSAGAAQPAWQPEGGHLQPNTTEWTQGQAPLLQSPTLYHMFRVCSAAGTQVECAPVVVENQHAGPTNH